MSENQHHFLIRLQSFIREVESMPRFAGQTAVIRSLKRIQRMAVFSG